MGMTKPGADHAGVRPPTADGKRPTSPRIPFERTSRPLTDVHYIELVPVGQTKRAPVKSPA
jgi:hypothetical protein